MDGSAISGGTVNRTGAAGGLRSMDNPTLRILRNRNAPCSKAALPYWRCFHKLPADEQERLAAVIDWLRLELSAGRLSTFGIFSALELIGKVNEHLQGKEPP